MLFCKILQGKMLIPKLEYDLAEHCNLRCINCNHSSPFTEPHFPTVDDFKKDISRLAEVCHARLLILMGGEPLLNKNILEFVRIARQSRIADKIYISTNGLLLNKLSDNVLQEVDAIYVNWYPNTRCDETTITSAKKRCSQKDTKFLLFKTTKFVKCFVDYEIQDESLVDSIYKTCDTHFFHCHAVYKGKYYKCHHCMYLNRYLDKRGVAAPNFVETDGIPLHRPDLLNRLVAYKSDTTPLKACYYCLGGIGKLEPWRELNREEVASPPGIDKDITNLIDYKKMRINLSMFKVLKLLGKRLSFTLHPALKHFFFLNLYYENILKAFPVKRTNQK